LIEGEGESKKEEMEEPDDEFRFSYLHPNFDNKLEKFSKEKNLEKLKKRLSYWLGTYWLQFDDAYLKPKLICNWPEVKKEHDEIAEVITDVIKNYIDEKDKREDEEINNNADNDEEENEMKEKLFNGNKDDKYNDYKTNYMKLHDDENETEDKKN
jgi:hypothetical protein